MQIQISEQTEGHLKRSFGSQFDVKERGISNIKVSIYKLYLFLLN